MIKIIFLTLSCSMLWLTVATAQGFDILTNQVTVNTIPSIPQPLQDVQIEIISYIIDLDRSDISLFVNDKLQEQGIGKQDFTVQAPAVGQQLYIRLEIATLDKGTITKKISITPAQVDILFEAHDAHVPLFYTGKKLPIYKAGLTAVAMPYILDQSGNKLDPATLIYTWKINDQVQTEFSGYGKQKLVIDGDSRHRAQQIHVQVESVNQTYIAQRSIDLPIYEPVIRFYQEHPLWGTDLSQAIVANKPIYLEVPEMVIRSVPFFFSDIESQSDVTYNWRLNGNRFPIFSDRNIVNLRAEDDGQGESRFSLKINHNDKILQIAESIFIVVFGEQAIKQRRGQSTSGDTPNYFGAQN